MCKVVDMPQPDQYGKLAEEIRVLRTRPQMPQDQLAQHIGMHPNTLTRRMASPGDFTVAELVRISDVFGVELTIALDGITAVEG